MNSPEKMILEDFLTTQKQATNMYNTWSGECVDTNLRNKFLDILKEEHDIQNEIFTEMSTRGFYPVKPAQQTEIDAARQKFC